MICNLEKYNPFPAIQAQSKAIGGRVNYSSEFYDFVRKELLAAGICFETTEELDQALVLLLNMDVI